MCKIFLYTNTHLLIPTTNPDPCAVKHLAYWSLIFFAQQTENVQHNENGKIALNDYFKYILDVSFLVTIETFFFRFFLVLWVTLLIIYKYKLDML